MKDETQVNLILFCAGLIVGLVGGIQPMIGYYHSEAIQRGFAHYNSTNGNWEWNTREIRLTNELPIAINWGYLHSTNYDIDAKGGIWLKQEAK